MIAKFFALAAFAVTAIAVDQRISEDNKSLQPATVLEFTVTAENGEAKKFEVFEYKNKMYQGTADMNAVGLRLLHKSETDVAMLAAYSQALQSQGNSELCADGQHIDHDRCLKCSGSAVVVVDCKSDALGANIQRRTYVGVRY